jgi:hypothetical protein
VTYPYVLLEGPTSQERIRWRAVVAQKEDINGILRETRHIELAESADKDAMGVQRWQPLTMKSPQSSWMLIAEAALDLALEKTS